MSNFLVAALLLIGQTELEHTERLAPKYGGDTKVILWDLTRPDMVTPTHAIEVDYARKWAEAIGQSLYYAIVTEKKPGILLLVKPDEDRFVYRCQTVCAKHGITMYVERIP